VRLGRRGYDFARTHLNWNVDARDFVRAIADARMLDLAKRDRVRATAKRVMGRGRGRTRV
jgi:hypothetical protein